MGVRLPPSQLMDKKETIKQAVLDYNAMAKVWNSLPGNKLIWPKDKFKIRYCGCEVVRRVEEYGKHKIKTCYACGYPLAGEWDYTT